MKVMTEEREFTKLCHANPGDVVRLVDCNMLAEGATYLVCVDPDPSKRPARSGISTGLYDDQRELFLVNIATGELHHSRREAGPMPHLSSRVLIYRRAEVHLGREARK